MNQASGILFLSAASGLKGLDQPLLRRLAQHGPVKQWEYVQSLDEPSSLTQAVDLLKTCIQSQGHPMHLVGHGLNGVIGLCLARQDPELVQSLTLLAVGGQPATTWHAHYYVQREVWPCSQLHLLVRLSRRLLITQSDCQVIALTHALQQDLLMAPCPHSLLSLTPLPQGEVPVPLMVCGSSDDPVVDPDALHQWLPWLKSGDQIWQCSGGRHFFHHAYPHLVEQKLRAFWQLQSCLSPQIMAMC